MDPGLHLHAAVVVQVGADCYHLSGYFSVGLPVLAFPAGLLVRVDFRPELGANHHSPRLGTDISRPSAVSVLDYFLELDRTSDPPVIDSGSFYCQE